MQLEIVVIALYNHAFTGYKRNYTTKVLQILEKVHFISYKLQLCMQASNMRCFISNFCQYYVQYKAFKWRNEALLKSYKKSNIKTFKKKEETNMHC